MNGKGSKPRPVDKDKFDKNFEKIFGSTNIKTIQKKKKPEKNVKN
jgi:hypothetical protein